MMGAGSEQGGLGLTGGIRGVDIHPPFEAGGGANGAPGCALEPASPAGGVAAGSPLRRPAPGRGGARAWPARLTSRVTRRGRRLRRRAGKEAGASLPRGWRANGVRRSLESPASRRWAASTATNRDAEGGLGGAEAVPGPVAAGRVEGGAGGGLPCGAGQLRQPPPPGSLPRSVREAGQGHGRGLPSSPRRGALRLPEVAPAAPPAEGGVLGRARLSNNRRSWRKDGQTNGAKASFSLCRSVERREAEAGKISAKGSREGRFGFPEQQGEMAAMAGKESETQLCNNCQKDIPLANYTIHEIHCSRNIGICPICKESFPKAEMRTHREQEHAQIICKCSMRMDRGLLQDHVALECPLRPVACQHCDIELAFCKLQDHEDYCGARTERCGRCNRNIMLRELKTHPVDCWKKARGEPGVQVQPCFNSEAPLRNIQTISDYLLRPDSTGESPLRGNRFLESQRHSWVSGNQLPRESSWRNRGPSRPDQNRAPLEKRATPLPVDGESDYNFDYLLALSLQHENSLVQPNVAEAHRELWKNICPPHTGPADHSSQAKNSSGLSQDSLVAADILDRPKTETRLPCEFCEELYPEEDLILHQTGCNPASALASFSKRSNLVPPTDCLSSLWGELPCSRSRGSGESFPFQPGIQDSLLLPCEFCGVQLEEEILFHHQDQCDLRPATAPSSGRTPAQSEAPVVESSVGTESPDLPRRRIRHQGELSSQYLEQLKQKKPCPPAHGNHSQVPARRTQLAAPNNRREDPAALSKGRKPRNLGDGEGRTPPGRGPSDPVATPLPARYSSPDFLPSSYVPSFPTAVPTRPSIRQEGGQSPAGPPHFNNSKARPRQVKSADPDSE